MAYKLKLDEPLEKGARRVAIEQLERACDAFESLDANAFVHEARKSLKRVRALLRLLRDALRNSQWQELNSELRNIGRLLSRHRDWDVRRDTLALLAKDAGKGLAAALERVTALDTGVRTAAPVSAPVSSHAPDAPPTSALRQAVDRMRAIRHDIAKLDADIDAEHLESGLERTHRAGHRAREAIQANPDSADTTSANASDEQFHELRKVVQIHWRQMQLLEAAWPELFKARIASARGLARDLGLEHDFSALAQWLEAPEAGYIQRPDARVIVSACRRAQADLRSAALREAEILFAGRPRVFASEAIAYWSAAVSACAAKKTKRGVAARNRAAPVPKGASARRPKAAAPMGTGPVIGDGDGGENPVRSKRPRKARTAPAG